jgi:hypothetical protein
MIIPPEKKQYVCPQRIYRLPMNVHKTGIKIRVATIALWASDNWMAIKIKSV